VLLDAIAMLHKSLVTRPEQTLGRQHQNEHVLCDIDHRRSEGVVVLCWA
jgi:hypothetical protein